MGFEDVKECEGYVACQRGQPCLGSYRTTSRTINVRVYDVPSRSYRGMYDSVVYHPPLSTGGYPPGSSHCQQVLDIRQSRFIVPWDLGLCRVVNIVAERGRPRPDEVTGIENQPRRDGATLCQGELFGAQGSDFAGESQHGPCLTLKITVPKPGFRRVWAWFMASLTMCCDDKGEIRVLDLGGTPGRINRRE